MDTDTDWACDFLKNFFETDIDLMAGGHPKDTTTILREAGLDLVRRIMIPRCWWRDGIVTFLEVVYMVDAAQHVGWGDGMVTLIEIAYMFDATQHVGSGLGEGMITLLELAVMCDATQHVGWGRLGIGC